MAKGLKAGDSVAVSKPLKFKRTSNEYKAGLKSLEQGQIGQVVDSARGRSVVVEIRLSDLPAEVRDRIQALMQAKLSLGLESEMPANNVASSKQIAAPVKGRRGRKPKAAQA